MGDRTTDPRYLDSQYDDAEKLRLRQETHRRYSERANELRRLGSLGGRLDRGPLRTRGRASTADHRFTA